MCGRYVSPEQAAIERAWRLGRHNYRTPFERHFNVAPTALVPLLRLVPDSGELELSEARWGLIPYWWDREKLPAFTHNARLEEAAGSSMWRDPLTGRRCLIPAEGWYEWRETERIDPGSGEIRKAKQPHFIRPIQGGLFAFAGIASRWRTPDGSSLLTCAILTRDAVPAIAAVHERMPVALTVRGQAGWLDPQMKEPAVVAEFARRHTDQELVHHPVSLRVNASRNDDAALIEPVSS